MDYLGGRKWERREQAPTLTRKELKQKKRLPSQEVVGRIHRSRIMVKGTGVLPQVYLVDTVHGVVPQGPCHTVAPPVCGKRFTKTESQL